ncbi:MAG: YggS family pyridoxal phosphate-dependent enzyme [Deltaproteobacteria bacterium]|nr:YggS family pyridoxal phosphate-dependent enzyme [Deltaproteobacteria bacterium]
MFKERLHTVTEIIRKTAQKCSRDPDSIRLVAVSKTKPADMIKKAIDAGVTILGENYIQETREKFDVLSAHDASWHFIGHLQTNKAKYAVKMFDLIHTVDSLKLAKELDKEAKKIGKKQNILIQVNVGMESSKSGISENETLRLIKEISLLDNISIKGLMTMPPFFDQPEKVRPFFTALRKLRDTIKSASIPNISVDELSMGMSGDYEVAIEEGATLVRVGTAIFGERN